MATKLKAYETSMGFFDLAIAAPSMKGLWKGGALGSVPALVAALKSSSFGWSRGQRGKVALDRDRHFEDAVGSGIV